MEKKSKLMIYVQADLAPDVIRWAIRLGGGTASFCNTCIAQSILNMERGMVPGRETPFAPWSFVSIWLFSQGKPFRTNLPETTVERNRPRMEAQYREAQVKLKKFEQELLEGKANTRILFQVNEGGDSQHTRWPDKVRKMAEHFQTKPNELANRMISGGITALEHENESYEPDFIAQYQREVALPRIAQLRSERLLAEQFDTHADVPPELVSDGWAFMALNETANVHYRALVDDLIEKKSVEAALKFLSLESYSPEYIQRMKEIYLNPVYQDWSEERPLRSKELKKEIIDAWVAQWRRRSSKDSPSLAEIKSRLADLSDTELEVVEKEISTLRTSRKRK